MNSSFKKLTVLVLVLLLVMSVVACGKSSNTSNTTSSSNNTDTNNSQGTIGAKETQNKSTISMWYHMSPTQAEPYLKLVKDFNNSQQNVTVETQFVPAAEIKKQISVGAAAKELPDIVLTDTPDTVAFAAMGIFEDITDKVNEWGEKDSFFSGPLSAVVYNNKYYGLPFYNNCLALFYNKDLFKEAGIVQPPTNWDELKEDAAKLTKGDVKGLAVCAAKLDDTTFQFMPFLWQAGADYDKLDTPEAREALNLWTDLYKKGYMSKEILNQNQADMSRSQFQTGKVGMMVNGPWIIANIKKETPNLNFGVAKLPKNKYEASAIGGYNMSIVKGKNADAAWTFMKFLMSAENVEYYNKNAGYIPPRKDVVDKSDYWKNDPVLSVFAEQMETARPRGPHPKWPEISTTIIDMVQQALTSTKSVDDALKDASSKIEQIIK